MSFWEKAWKVASDVGTSFASSVERSANEVREMKVKLEAKSDSELFDILATDGFFSDSREKGCAFGILRRRGYTVEDINARKA